MKSLEFEDLQEMVRIINLNKTKNIEVLGNADPEKSNVEKLYQMLARNKFTTDDEAAEFFFQSHAKDPRYKKLRAKLVDMLVNTAFFIDSQESKFSELRRALPNIYKEFSAIYILKYRGANRAAHFLANTLLEQAIKYELIPIVIELLALLIEFKGSNQTENSVFEKALLMKPEYEEKRVAENKAITLFKEVSMYFQSYQSPNMDIYKKAKTYYDELVADEDKIDTTSYSYHTYQIGTMACSSIGDYKKGLELSEEILQKLKGRPMFYRGRVHAVLLQKIFYITQLKLGEAVAEPAFEAINDYIDPGTFNWRVSRNVRFYYLLYLKRYEDAFDVFKSVFSIPEPNGLLEKIKDEWRLNAGYLFLLGRLGYINSVAFEEMYGEFKLGKFMNQFESLTKDREAFNIPLLFFPILYNLVEGNYEDYGRSEDALDKYRQRYLENDLNKRSASFLKILLALGKRRFEPVASQRKIDKELETIRSLQPDINRQVFFVEIIPYETLFEMLDSHLKK